MDKKCKKEVWHGWHAYPCKKRALDGSDFCGTHDPQRRAERAAKRGPTKFEREFAELARKAAEDEAMRSELDRLRAENAALREALEMIASPSGIEPRLWATYVARKALGQRITAFTLEWLESEEANRITMQAENAAVRRRVEDVAQWLRGCLGDPMRSRSPVVVIHKQMLLQAIIEPLEQALAAAKPAENGAGGA